MTTLTLDPSSTRTGYAIGTSRTHLIEAGILTPSKGNPVERAYAMAKDAVALIRDHVPATVVIETPSPQAPHGKAGARGQATYGMAVGIILATVRSVHRNVELVRADVWKRRVPKKHLIDCIANDFPQYDRKADRGGDCADAIGLLQWWYCERVAQGGAA